MQQLRATEGSLWENQQLCLVGRLENIGGQQFLAVICQWPVSDQDNAHFSIRDNISDSFCSICLRKVAVDYQPPKFDSFFFPGKIGISSDFVVGSCWFSLYSIKRQPLLSQICQPIAAISRSWWKFAAICCSCQASSNIVEHYGTLVSANSYPYLFLQVRTFFRPLVYSTCIFNYLLVYILVHPSLSMHILVFPCIS